jgi:predicted lactoylglutathione lyase
MPVPPVLSLVTLGVADVAASTRFYEALGFPLSSASVPGEVSFFRMTGGLLGVYGLDALAADAQLERGTYTGFRGATFAVNLASREAVDDAVAAAEQACARILKPAQPTEWGG